MKGPGILIAFCSAYILLCGVQNFAQKHPEPRIRTRPQRVIAPEPVVIEKWETFERQDARFSVSFPKAPETTESRQVENYPGVSVPYRSVTIQSYANKVFYMVNVHEYPKGLLHKRTDLAEDFGAWLKYYILRGVAILGERKMSYGRFALVEFVYRPTQQEIVVHRAVVVGDRLFQLMVQFPISASETPEQGIERNRERIHKFFDSFYVAEDVVVDSTVG